MYLGLKISPKGEPKSGVAKAALVAPMAPSLYTTVNQKHGYSFVRLQYVHGYQQNTISICTSLKCSRIH